jgi:hypothetical protein
MLDIPELIRARVNQALASGKLDSDDREGAQRGLLPLFDDLAYRYYLREDGAVFILDALEPEAGLQEMTDDTHRVAVLRALVEDAPEFGALIPPPPPGTTPCTACGGTGRSPVLTVTGSRSSTICLQCRGTGWVPVEQAAV